MDVSRLPAITNPALAPSAAPSIADNLATYQRHAAGALARNTERALAADTAAFSAWCERHGFAPLPAPAELVAVYVDTLAAGCCRADCADCARWHVDAAATSSRWKPQKSPATIRRHLASLAAWHRAAGVPTPTTAEPVRLAMKRAAKRTASRQKQAPGMRWEHVARMLATLGDSLGDRRDAALLLVAYDSLARRSELVALDAGDLEPDADGSASILIRRSKTDQAGEGMTRELAPDTLRRVRAWLDAAGITDGPLFRTVRHGRAGGRLPAGDVERIWRRLAERAGIAARFTGHSSRVGGAQDLAGDGFSVVEIQLAGGWKSPTMVARYAERLDMKRTARRRAAMKGRD